jgi:electron transfer flavoprotein alpha subunit
MPNNVLIIAEEREGALRKVSYELVTVANDIAKNLGGAVEAVVMGNHIASCADALAKTGVQKVYSVDSPTLANFVPEVFAATLANIINQTQPAVVLLPATGFGKELGAQVAAKLDWGLATDCTGYQFENGTLLFRRPVYAGKAIATVKAKALPVMASIRPNIFPPVEPGTSAAPIEQVQVADVPVRSKVIEKVKKEAAAVDLNEAKIVISGGRGVKSAEGFKPIHELANMLGAAVGASRAAVDAGWIDYSTQVGQTGKTVAPQLYIALGISGAIQHLAGMSSSKVIVAVNKDPDAPIFKVADYGIVGDMFEVLPVLKEELQKVLAQK